MSESSNKGRPNALVELFPAGKKKERRIPRLVYASANGPAKRVTDDKGRVSYRPFGGNEYTGGKWIRGASK